MRKYLALLLVPLAACDSDLSAPNGGAASLSEAAIAEHLYVLADDSMFGRGAGSEHEREAAEYISRKFDEYALEEGVPGFLQSFPAGDPREVIVDTLGLQQSQNVLGVLPGEGELAGEWIIVGAHYDHIGYNRVSADSVIVFNGADDNASGTALITELARVLSEAVAAGELTGERRSIMFQAYGAEEIGLVGSTYYCNQPTVPIGSIVAMLNFDMVGRLHGNGLTMIGASSSADWPGLLNGANHGGLSWRYADGLMDRSDQACFYQRGVPVLFFHTGLHSQYHTAYDDTWLIDRGGMVRIGELAKQLLLDLAVEPDPPAFSGN